MSGATSIEWTDATWNPVRGCTRVSAGCQNCYAERVAARMSKPGQWGQGFARFLDGRHGSVSPRWTGVVRLIREALELPLRWRRPRRVFVNSMSDLFHEGLPFEDIASVYSVMAQTTRHTYQVLTKRPSRRLAFVEWLYGIAGLAATGLSRIWPLANVWEGVSVEDQPTADERIPLLLQTPAAKRFVSYEPGLGPVDFNRREWLCKDWPNRLTIGKYLDWIIVGGESGPGARPFNLRWVRLVVEQCRQTETAAFVKQLGARPCLPTCASPECTHPDCDPGWLKLRDHKGGDPAEWPEDLRVRQFPQ